MKPSPDDGLEGHNDAMMNLLNQPTAGRPHERAGARANRWLGWAQSLFERRSRVVAGRRILLLAFLQPAAARPPVCERWLQAAQRISPQIHLSIGPILGALQPAGRFGTVIMERRMARGETPSSRSVPNPGEMVMVERWEKALQIIRGGRMADPAPGLQTIVLEKERNAGRRPLERVFARAGAGETSGMTDVHRTVRETPPAERNVGIVQRVVEERRRVEEPARRTLIVREQRDASRVAAAAQETVVQSPRGLQVGAQGMFRTDASSIDLEQLTDRVVRNIDNRIIAHRERTGRLF